MHLVPQQSDRREWLCCRGKKSNSIGGTAICLDDGCCRRQRRSAFAMTACAPAPSRSLVLGDQNPYSLTRHASNRVKPYLLFPWAAELGRHASILDLVEAVIGPEILVFHTTGWLKPPPSEN